MRAEAEGGDRAAGGGGDGAWLERELKARADGMEAMGRRRSPLVGLLREAASTMAEMRRAIELSRVWWDETASPYKNPWNHEGFPCDRNPCPACQARAAAMAIVGPLEGGAINDGTDV